MPVVPALADRDEGAPWRVVWGARDGGRFKGRDFFQKECDADQQEQFEALFRLLEESDDGRIANDQSFKYPLEAQGNLGEFKIRKKRLFFFRDGNDFVITNGCTKKKDETDKEDLKRAHLIRRQMTGK